MDTLYIIPYIHVVTILLWHCTYLYSVTYIDGGGGKGGRLLALHVCLLVC